MTRQREEVVERQRQGMNRPGVHYVPKGSGEQGKAEETGCEIICGAPTTLAFKGLMMMMMIDKSTEWATIPACPSLMHFYNRSNTEGTNSSKMFCLMFVYVFCTFVSAPISWFWDNFFIDDLCAE